MGKLDGKVALITGAARGQGRSHAVTFAREGADVIVIDLCRQLDSVPYGMSRDEDLATTVRLVEEVDRRAPPPVPAGPGPPPGGAAGRPGGGHLRPPPPAGPHPRPPASRAP